VRNARKRIERANATRENDVEVVQRIQNRRTTRSAPKRFVHAISSTKGLSDARKYGPSASQQVMLISTECMDAR
jgi:hypothetical protein